MKPFYLVLAVLASVALVTMGSHQIYAPRSCAGCSEFKKLTDEFETKVLNTALGSPEEIPALVDEYSNNVKALFSSPSPSP